MSFIIKYFFRVIKFLETKVISFVFIVSCMLDVTGENLCADNTKIWRSIRNEEDNVQLQRDIDNLHTWSIDNNIMFRLGNGHLETHFCNQ